MPADMHALLDDLVAETQSLSNLLGPVTPEKYSLPTPAVGWALRDQISHLAYFDEAATLAATNPDRFQAEATELMARGEDFADAVADDLRGLDAASLLPWFTRVRRELVSVYRGLDARHRIPWYGVDMSAASCITARLMETWAHGQDVADALGVERQPSTRLRHIADLGVRTRGFSFTLNNRPSPAEPVRVTLLGPDESRWTWDEGAVDFVEGSVLDFCLVVTQRRNLDETNLRVRGDVAEAWMSLAQAFAGPPGRGRTPVRRTGGSPVI